jgi:hypothetical protein
MPSIFLSYRRTDAPGHAGRLYDRLVERFGAAGVFKDLDSLEPGADFGTVIEDAVARCDALIAVIGRDWLAPDADGRRRLDTPEDWVRLEIGHALKRGIRVIPVLVEGARMPSAAELPADLQALARRHAVELSESAWHPQVRQLIDALDALVGSGAGLHELVAAEVHEILTTDRDGAFRVVSSRAQPGDYLQWIGSPDEGLRVEIADPGRNELPPRPLTPRQLAAVDRLGFSEQPDANFARTFAFSDEALPHIVNVITTAFAEVFGVTEAQQVAVSGDNLDG